MKYISRIVFIVLLLVLAGCDHGISPTSSSSATTQTGISGTIYYQNWPSADSLVDLRLIVFKIFPPGNIFDAILNNEATVYPPLGPESLPLNVDSTKYEVSLTPGRYDYVVVAQQFGASVTEDWLAVGQYDTDTDSLPTAIDVVQDSLLTGIDIFVDFHHLPVQPF